MIRDSANIVGVTHTEWHGVSEGGCGTGSVPTFANEQNDYEPMVRTYGVSTDIRTRTERLRRIGSVECS